MIIKYCKLERGNFGDDLNDWLWPKLIPDLLIKENDNNFLIGIGTILGSDFNSLSGKKIVFSSGTGYKTGAKIDNTWDIIGVRGYKTAEIYNISAEKVLCDGAYLLRQVLDRSEFSHGNKIGFMPHNASIDLFDWESVCKELDMVYISPEASVDFILEELKKCNKLITEAMHGAIVADALRIPWCAVSYSPRFLRFKWDDWVSVLEINLVIHQLPFVIKRGIDKKIIRKWKIKQFLGSLGLGKAKWKSFPKINDNNINKDELIEKLKNLKLSEKFQLSSNKTMVQIDQKLTLALQYLRTTY
jgi:succinoglycan biosynthesis protein ExoV